MAASDARPVPRKGVAYRVYFPIFDADGDLVSGATGLDSEVSKDAGNYADCTNEATEIQSTGTYYLDLTATEMDADAVVVIVKTTSSGAKTTPIFLYPEEAGDFRVDVVQVSGDSAAADNLETACDNYSATRGLAGTALPNAAADAAGGLPISDAGGLDLDARLDAAISSRAAASDLATVAGYLDTEVAAIKERTDNLPDDPADHSAVIAATDAIKADTAAILADTGTDGVVVAAGSKTGYALAATGLDSITATDPGGVASTFPQMVVQLWRRFFKKATTTATEMKTYADDGSTVRTTQTVSDDGATQTQGAAS